MAAECQVTEAEFRARYARMIDGRWSLNETKTKHGYDCVFLDRKTIPGKAICGMYASRPQHCRTWPFWPEILSTKRSWEDYRRQTPCPGMGSGTLVPIESIRVQRDSMQEGC
jgi:Fe-S-cluster containining protein